MPNTATPTIVQVPLAAIVAGDNDRTEFRDAELRALADNIADVGLVQPPTLRPLPDGRYEIIAGERRVRAMRLLGWATIPAMVRETTDEQAAEVMLVENLVRVDLDPVAEARAYAKRTATGTTTTELAKLVGRTVAHVERRLGLLALCDRVLDMVAKGQIAPATAGHMVGLDPDRQALALAALVQGANVAAFKALVARLREEQDQDSMFTMQVDEYVATAKAEARYGPVGQLRVMVKKMAAALNDTDPELVAEAKALLSELNKG